MSRPKALITGASSGIGKAYAERLAGRGYDLVLVARDRARLDALADELRKDGAASEVLAADLTQSADVARVEQKLESDTAISFLLNNAGIATVEPQLKTSVQTIQTLIALNVTAATRLALAAGRAFTAQKRGTIVNMASAVAVNPDRETAYRYWGDCLMKQGDLMQARWGTHGDHPVVALAPNSVQEIYSETIRAFGLAERLRTPVIVLFDEVIAHLIEPVKLPAAKSIAVAERKWAKGDERDFQPFAETDDLVPPMARPGDGLRVHATGLTHTPDGFPTQRPAPAARAVLRLIDKIERHRDEIERFEAIDAEDAEFVVVAVGIVARAARRAVADLRAEGIKAGLFRPITLWPFPERALAAAAGRARRVLVAEMNAGQLALEVERIAAAPGKVARLNRIDGEPIAPAEIVAKIRELAAHG